MGASSSITSSGKTGPADESREVLKPEPTKENIEIDCRIETLTEGSTTLNHAVENMNDNTSPDKPARTEETKLEIIKEFMAEDNETGYEGDGIHHPEEDNPEFTLSEMVNVNKKQIQKLFSLFDEDNSGSISSLELGKLVRSLGMYESVLHNIYELVLYIIYESVLYNINESVLYIIYESVLYNRYELVLFVIYESVLYIINESVLYIIYESVLYIIYESVLYILYESTSYIIYANMVRKEVEALPGT